MGWEGKYFMLYVQLGLHVMLWSEKVEKVQKKETAAHLSGRERRETLLEVQPLFQSEVKSNFRSFRQSLSFFASV